MKLKKYLKKLKEIEKEYGGDLEVIYASDPEGNSYHSVPFSPSVGNFDENGDFESDGDSSIEVNAVCVN